MRTGWNTTDEDEIAQRRKRAKKEDFTISRLLKRDKTYSTYEVVSKTNIYLVELRSFEEEINSCSCPDIAVNGLGTCKHIEAVKLSLEDHSAKNRHIEIFLDTKKDKIVILYPIRSKKHSPLRDKLAPFFSDNGELLSDPLLSYGSLKRTVEGLNDNHKKKVRLSRLIEPWLEAKETQRQRVRDRETFFNDYQDGKRSLDFLKHTLYDYQKEGLLHLAFTERALLADEMGLGKTVQAIGASVLLHRLKGIKKVLIISPASLKSEWEEQIARFTDHSTRFIVGSRVKREQEYAKESFFYLANYEQILYDVETINTVLKPDIIILDEAQRIKNWQTKTANSIKKLQSRYAFVLTGTPIENRIDEIYSIVQFLDPKIFGPLFRFNRDFYKLDHNGVAVGYKNITALHERLEPVMLRRRKSEVEGELPERTITNYFVKMSDEQQTGYDEYEVMVSRLAAKARKYPLSFEEMKRLQLGLSCMRMLCDTPYILDKKSKVSPKIDEIMPIIEELLEEGSHKIIIFSEWEKMLQLLNRSLKAKDIDVAWHTGSFSQLQRRDEIRKFKESRECNIFLSTDSGSVGLNLQMADTVINLDMPWNPAKLEQRIARAWRKHQTKSVQVINLITQDRIEHRILHVVEQKQHLSDNVLDGFGKDEMDLPSGRKAILKDIDRLMPSVDSKKPKKNTYSAENFVEDVVARFSDRIESVQESPSTQTIFVVVDTKDEKLEASLHSIVEENLEEKHVRILQRQEYALIKELIQQGMIEAKGELKQLYLPTPKEKQDPEQVKKAKKTYGLLKRKYAMAMLLHDGGFTQESLPVFCDSVENALHILATLQGDNDPTVSIQQIADVLIKKYDLKDDLTAFVEKIRERYDMEDSDQIIANAKALIEKVTSLVGGL